MATNLGAQHFSYISDRRFFEPADMIGYDFKPWAMEIPNEEKRDLAAGEYSFGITANNLYVHGEGIKGVYNINNMQPADFGFKILLMNARDARLQGHLKVIQNKFGMVEALIFKRSSNEKEIIFYLPPIPGSLKDQEKEFFTDRGELVIEHKDSIWGRTIKPFHILHRRENLQQRIQMTDNVRIMFTEEVTIEEKEVKKKNKKEKDAQTVEGETSEEPLAEQTPLEPEESDQTQPSNATALDAPEVKVKITKEYLLTVHSAFTNDQGAKEETSQKYPIRRVNEKEDATAGMQEEKYVLEFANDKKEVIKLYLNGDRTVSTLEIGDKKYFARGF